MNAEHTLGRPAFSSGIETFIYLKLKSTFVPLIKDRMACVAAIFLLVLIVSAVAAPILAPFDPRDQDLMHRLSEPGVSSPNGMHWLGTDELGRDVLSRLMYGSRVTLAVAAGAVFVCFMFGTLLGMAAGYIGGWLDTLLMRLVDLMMAFPLLLLALVCLYILGPSLQNVIIVLAVVRWPMFARIARARTLSVKQELYVLAAQSIGAKTPRIMFLHVLPNLLTPLLVLATLEVAANILTESSLSFLGMGVQPPDASWGLMLSDAREYIFGSPWLITIPGLAIFTTVLSTNQFGMWLRILNDPLQRWRLN